MCDLSVDRSIAAHFATLEDPRCETQRRHNLMDMIVIAIAATLPAPMAGSVLRRSRRAVVVKEDVAKSGCLLRVVLLGFR